MRRDAIGLAWCLTVLLCEAGFTLLAAPVLGPLGPVGVSVHTTWLAAAGFGVLGVGLEGPGAMLQLSRPVWLATAYVAVMVTAVAFVPWYSTVRALGAARAGLLTGVAPVAAAFTGIVLGGPAPHLGVWIGIAVVIAGLALGLHTPTGHLVAPRIRRPVGLSHGVDAER